MVAVGRRTVDVSQGVSGPVGHFAKGVCVKESGLYSKEARLSSSVPRNYPDLWDHLAALDDKGLMRRVDRPINKDTEIPPLVRWQCRGDIEAEYRKAWLFEEPTIPRARNAISWLRLRPWSRFG